MLPRATWRMGALGALLLLGTADAATAQVATTVGPNPQVIAAPPGGDEHAHGYDAAPPPATLGGPFELVDQRGTTVTERSLRGHWTLLYFGYAGCAESCPVALQTMAATLDILGKDAERVAPVFVDFGVVYSRIHHAPSEHMAKIDPVSFASEIHPRLAILSGTRRNMYQMLRVYRVRQEHSPLAYGRKDAGMRIDHTTRIYLVDPDGKTAAYYYHTISPADLANDLLLRMAG